MHPRTERCFDCRSLKTRKTSRREAEKAQWEKQWATRCLQESIRNTQHPLKNLSWKESISIKEKGNQRHNPWGLFGKKRDHWLTVKEGQSRWGIHRWAVRKHGWFLPDSCVWGLRSWVWMGRRRNSGGHWRWHRILVLGGVVGWPAILGGHIREGP